MLSLPVKSSLHPDSLPLARANSFPFCTYKFPRPQLLQNQQLSEPPVSADSKATLTSLDSALTDALALTPAESALTKNGGGGIPPGTGPMPARQLCLRWLPAVLSCGQHYSPNRQLRTDDRELAMTNDRPPFATAPTPKLALALCFYLSLKTYNLKLLNEPLP